MIGILGLGFHTVFQSFLDWSFLCVIPALGSPGSVQAFKWTAGAMLILPQSILLGATFPLISGGLVRLAPRRSGELLALLYFTNCLGAAIGVLVSGFLLINLVGLPGTLLTAGLLNILLAHARLVPREGRASSQPKRRRNSRRPTARIGASTGFQRLRS